jgi:thioredoxin-like negative regulator of GroEL
MICSNYNNPDHAFLPATNHSGKLSVLKYNVEDPNTKNLKVEMLLQGVMIRGLPTLVLYHDGKPLATHSGAITENELNAWLDEHLFSKIDTFEAGQELGGEVAKKKVWDEKRSDTPGSKNASAKRGFVSMTSQFGSDDYMLSNV